MIFRLSQILNSKIEAGALQVLPLDENPFADWSVHLFVANRTQYIMVSNTKSLYSTVMIGKGIVNETRFTESALNSIRESMENDRLEFVYQQHVAPSSGVVSFSKPLSRTVTGSMNDLINHAKFWLTEGGFSPHEVGFNLNGVFLSAIATSPATKYGKPRDAFKAMIDAAGA